MNDLIEAIDDLADSLERISLARYRESLKHAKHADVLTPIRAEAQRIIQKLFKAQKRALLKAIKPRLREADEDAKQKASSVISDIPLSLTSGMQMDYAKALTAALNAGYDGLAGELDSDSEIAVDTVEEYLRDHSLTKLTGNFSKTTIERLRNALADAYTAGGDYDGLVAAVQDAEAFGDVRAGMIAQTEMNAAYNSGRKELGLDLGFNEKSWNPDGTACVAICIPNVLGGWIGIDEEFDSGDDAPPGHPNCDCSLDVRFNPHAVLETEQ